MVPDVSAGMNLVGLMLVRNEDWVIDCSLRVALEWCDQVVVYLDRCTDKTREIVTNKEINPDGRILYMMDADETAEHWNEMNVRHSMLVAGRKMCRGTHFAIIDADEILTANRLPYIRRYFAELKEGQLIQVPMVPVWEGLDRMRDDSSVWSNARLTLGWKDKPDMGWAPREDGYQHHNRAPYGAIEELFEPLKRGEGGVMHLQFANKRRLLAKHVLYRMVDHLRWPGRRSVGRLNQIYDEALAQADKLSPVPFEWWGDHRQDLINLYGVPWQEAEIVRLLNQHGRQYFQGLDLKGF